MAGLLTYLCLIAFPFIEQWHWNNQDLFGETQQRVLSAIFTLFPFNLLF
jgi:hypothetical protein